MKKIFQKNFITILTMVLGVFLLNSCQKEFTITAVANDTSMGTVTGGGVYKKGTAVQLTAVPVIGYHFEKWDDGNTDNPSSVTVDKNATYTAIFVVDGSGEEEFAITVVSNDVSMGTVTGGGVYKKGTSVQLVAKPASGCQFAKWDDGNTDNPRTITVKSNATYMAVFIVEGGGEPTSKCEFSVSATKKVLFSPGNLQWSASGSHAVAGGGTAAGTWRFATNQYDTIGAYNRQISSSYTGYIDLFGWGTSGYNNKYPYMTSTTNTDYGNGENNITGTNYDWGVYNAIYNPKTGTTDAPGTWRTLINDEWMYLLETRATTSNIRYAKAKVCGIAGLIIVPDDWSTSVYPLNNTNISTADYTSNMINASDWAKMEVVGCIFLPVAGHRDGTSVNNVGSNGCYWSATYDNSSLANEMYFNSSYVSSSSTSARRFGESVRLVKDVK